MAPQSQLNKKKFQIQDNKTGKSFEIDWDGPAPPTDNDIDEIFSSQKTNQPSANERNIATATGKSHGKAIDTVYNYGKEALGTLGENAWGFLTSSPLMQQKAAINQLAEEERSPGTIKKQLGEYSEGLKNTSPWRFALAGIDPGQNVAGAVDLASSIGSDVWQGNYGRATGNLATVALPIAAGVGVSKYLSKKGINPANLPSKNPIVPDVKPPLQLTEVAGQPAHVKRINVSTPPVKAPLQLTEFAGADPRTLAGQAETIQRRGLGQKFLPAASPIPDAPQVERFVGHPSGKVAHAFDVNAPEALQGLDLQQPRTTLRDFDLRPDQYANFPGHPITPWNFDDPGVRQTPGSYNQPRGMGVRAISPGDEGGLPLGEVSGRPTIKSTKTRDIEIKTTNPQTGEVTTEVRTVPVGKSSEIDAAIRQRKISGEIVSADWLDDDPLYSHVPNRLRPEPPNVARLRDLSEGTGKQGALPRVEPIQQGTGKNWAGTPKTITIGSETPPVEPITPRGSRLSYAPEKVEFLSDDALARFQAEQAAREQLPSGASQGRPLPPVEPIPIEPTPTPGFKSGRGTIDPNKIDVIHRQGKGQRFAFKAHEPEPVDTTFKSGKGVVDPEHDVVYQDRGEFPKSKRLKKPTQEEINTMQDKGYKVIETLGNGDVIMSPKGELPIRLQLKKEAAGQLPESPTTKSIKSGKEKILNNPTPDEIRLQEAQGWTVKSVNKNNDVTMKYAVVEPIKPVGKVEGTTEKPESPKSFKDVSAIGANLRSHHKILMENPVTAPIAEHLVDAYDRKLPWIRSTLNDASPHIKGLNKAARIELGKALDSGDFSNLSPDMQKRAAGLKQVFEDIHKRFPAGKNVGQITNYYTHMGEYIEPGLLRSFADLFKKEKVDMPSKPPGVGNLYQTGLGTPDSPYIKRRTGALKDIDYDIKRVLPRYTESVARVIFDEPAVAKSKEILRTLPESKIKDLSSWAIRNASGFSGEPSLGAKFARFANKAKDKTARAFVDWNIPLHMYHLGELPVTVAPKLGGKYSSIGVGRALASPVKTWKKTADLGLIQGEVKPLAFKTAGDKYASAAQFLNAVERFVKGSTYEGALQKFLDEGHAPDVAATKALRFTKDVTLDTGGPRKAKGFFSESNISGGEIGGSVGSQFKGVPAKIAEQMYETAMAAKRNPKAAASMLAGSAAMIYATKKGAHTFHLNPASLAKTTAFGAFGTEMTEVFNALYKGDYETAMESLATWNIPGGQHVAKPAYEYLTDKEKRDKKKSANLAKETASGKPPTNSIRRMVDYVFGEQKKKNPFEFKPQEMR